MTRNERKEAHQFSLQFFGFWSNFKSYSLFSLNIFFFFTGTFFLLHILPLYIHPLYSQLPTFKNFDIISLHYALLPYNLVIPEKFLCHSLHHKGHLYLFLKLKGISPKWPYLFTFWVYFLKQEQWSQMFFWLECMLLCKVDNCLSCKNCTLLWDSIILGNYNE